MESFDLNTDNLENFDFKSLFNNIFDENGHIVFLLDRTIKEYIFDEWINDVKKENIEFIPLGITKKEPNLFFLLIDNKFDLENRINEFEKYLKGNLIEKSNEFYLYGFGVINDELSTIASKFKKKLKLEDNENVFLFRWYDPRVSIYLNEIFETKRVNDLFSIFKYWSFTHPSGMYTFNIKGTKSFYKKIGINESKDLDLIEISNLIYFDLLPVLKDINHIEIFKVLKKSITEYKLIRYQDIFLFGYYSFIVNPHFYNHYIFKEKLTMLVDFCETIENITNDEWLIIKNDCIGAQNG